MSPSSRPSWTPIQQRHCYAVRSSKSEGPGVLTNPIIAGIAMYSSIMKTKTRPGDWIAILGAGGGLGHMYGKSHRPQRQWTIDFILRGIQIAVKKGLKVIAIDR